MVGSLRAGDWCLAVNPSRCDTRISMGEWRARVTTGLRVAFVDCETTGVGRFDVPITIGVVVARLDESGYGEIIERWHGEQHPGMVGINPHAYRVHGRTAESLLGKSFSREDLRLLLSRSDVLVAHNASFDARMLATVVPDVRSAAWRCTQKQWVWPKLGNRKLDTVCEHFGVARGRFHTATEDAEILYSALMVRTGKTARSATYAKRLLSKPPFKVVQPRWPGDDGYVSTWDRSSLPGRPVEAISSEEVARAHRAMLEGNKPKEGLSAREIIGAINLVVIAVMTCVIVVKCVS